jgi:hypothetical protein
LRKIHNVPDPEKDEEKKVKGRVKGQIAAFSSITQFTKGKNSVAFLTYCNGTKFGPYLQHGITALPKRLRFF